ncbi:MAG: hypothetical protein CVT66_04505 [Actinobacteria bacterium HGW-Actinobacteria-6]|nr:MAG: hypothetical protein CVT66_04505 [Actinobacteria bacterium HGW-Actinobacteria-6]
MLLVASRAIGRGMATIAEISIGLSSVGVAACERARVWHVQAVAIITHRLLVAGKAFGSRARCDR